MSERCLRNCPRTKPNNKVDNNVELSKPLWTKNSYNKIVVTNAHENKSELFPYRGQKVSNLVLQKWCCFDCKTHAMYQNYCASKNNEPLPYPSE